MTDATEQKKIDAAEAAPVKSVCANPCFACGTAPFPTVRCVACGITVRVEDPFADSLCDVCASKYPASLLKAAVDPFEYALKLRTGEVMNFTSAKFAGTFVHLSGVSAPRGVDVRIADIVWCRDEGR